MYGQAVTLTAAVSVVAPATGTADGVVNFYDGGTLIGTSLLDSNGDATLTANGLAAGVHDITAVYEGWSLNASTSAAFDLTIAPATPNVNVFDAGGVYDGSSFDATPTVWGVVPGVDNSPASSLEGVLPTLVYYSGTDASGTPLAGAPTATGVYTVVASFPGSADYTSAQSYAETFTIGAVATTTELTPSESPANYTDGVDYTATVTASGSPVNTGTVNFTYSDSVDGVLAVDPVAVVDGVAVDSGWHSLLPYSVQAVYSDASAYYGGSGATINEAVNPIATSLDLQASENPANLRGLGHRYGDGVNFSASHLSSRRNGDVHGIGCERNHRHLYGGGVLRGKQPGDHRAERDFAVIVHCHGDLQ